MTMHTDANILNALSPRNLVLAYGQGVFPMVQDGELTNYVDGQDLPGSMDRLIQMALDRGGKDNITGILVRVDP